MTSGVGGEMTETDKLLSAIRYAREKVCMQKAEGRLFVQEKKKRKLEAGARVVERAMNSDAIVSSEEDENSERDSGNGDEAERGGDSLRKRRCTVSHSEQMKGGVDRFNAVLKHGDEAHRTLQEKSLAVEKRKLDAAERKRAAHRKERGTERKEDRKERAEERESRKRLEMETFRMMMEMMMNYRK